MSPPRAASTKPPATATTDPKLPSGKAPSTAVPTLFSPGKMDTSLTAVGPAKDATTTSTLKRKKTDINLEVITIDAKPDLTLIVGSTSHSDGQKAFKVNKGSIRNVSPVWSKMLNGNWKESDMSDINFPDDSCNAFLLVLKIAHFQLSQLPSKLSQQELLDLAILTDKYELQAAVRIGLDLKKWMDPFHTPGTTWSAKTDLHDFCTVTLAFDLKSDYDFLVNRLAMEVHVDENGEDFFYWKQKQKVVLRSDTPGRVIAEIKRIRSKVLSAWVARCTAALNDAMKLPLPPCKKPLCAATKLGVMIVGLKKAGLYPSPTHTDDMHRSVLSYLDEMRGIGIEHNAYNAYYTSCSFYRCFRDFGIVRAAQSTLRRYTHKDLWKQWKKATPRIISPAYDSDTSSDEG